MTLGIAPPEYFPGLELAALGLSVDVLVLADTFQYVRQSRQNRARLRTPTGTQWMTIPLRRHQFGRSVGSVRLDPDADWRRVHPKTLRFNYGASAYYEHYVEDVSGVCATPGDTLAAVTGASVRWVLDALRAGTRVVEASTLPGVPGRLEAVRALFPAFRALLLPAQARRTDELREGDEVAELRPFAYRQAFEGFEAGCSSLDLLMNQGPRGADLLRTHLQRRPARDGDVAPEPGTRPSA